ALVPPPGASLDRGPSPRRPWTTSGQQGAWLPWTWRALDPGACAPPLASYESAGGRLRRTRLPGQGDRQTELGTARRCVRGHLSIIRRCVWPFSYYPPT